MRALIIGGAGYIGSHAARVLSSGGWSVTVLDNLATGRPGAVPQEMLVRGDLHDRRLLSEVLARGFDVVFHFAAFSLVGESVRDPGKYWDNNLVGALELVRAMVQHGPRALVFSSTAAVYGMPAVEVIDESRPLQPINPYGRTKLAIEHLLDDFSHAHGLCYAALRYFNAAGADPSGEHGEHHEPETHLIPLVLRAALSGGEIAVFGSDYETRDGTCVRDYVHIDDLVHAHRAAAERVIGGQRSIVANLGSESGHTVREVIDTARRVSERDIAVREAPRRPGDPPRLVASCARAREVLGWAPRRGDLATIIEDAWRWHRDHPAGYA